MSGQVGKNRGYQVSVRGFKIQCGRVCFGRSYSEYSVDKTMTFTDW